MSGNGEPNLLRQAIAALLNSANPTIGPDYPLTTSQVISQVDAAIASGDSNQMNTLQTNLAYWNSNFTCPLS